jgi:predicted HTH domain antitoxin
MTEEAGHYRSHSFPIMRAHGTTTGRMIMATVTVELPDDAFSALRLSPREFAHEMRGAAAIIWYHRGLISQGMAAEIAGLTRADFLDALFRAKVSACQVTIDDLEEELESWQRLSDGSSTLHP